MPKCEKFDIDWAHAWTPLARRRISSRILKLPGFFRLAQIERGAGDVQNIWGSVWAECDFPCLPSNLLVSRVSWTSLFVNVSHLQGSFSFYFLLSIYEATNGL